MKKITLFMMALIMTFGAMAQFPMEQKIMQNNTASNVVVLNKNLSLNNLSNAKLVNHVNGTKTVGATITDVTVGTTIASSGFPLSFTVTPSADCASYFVSLYPTGLLEAFTSNLDTTVMILRGGSEFTGTQTLNGYATPGSTTIYVLAVAADQTTSIATSNFVTANIGGTGTANIVITVPTVNTTNADVTATINDQTAYYYLGVYAASGLNGATNDDVLADLQDNSGKIYASDAWTYGTETNPLTNLTEYVVYGFAFNQNDVLGTYTAPIHFTTGTNGLNDVEGVSSSVYPNPAKDDVNIAAKAKIERVEMFNMMGQRVSEKSVNSMFTSVNVANLNAGTYVVKVYTNAGVATKKIVVE